ncbi:MAG: GGDEF domain-containing response regulator [Prochlorotrichaceae cyanobacterium]|jgi:diguanylate cyclase (GGDEF)-like protein
MTFSTPSSEKPSSEILDPVRLQPATILLVDDDLLMRKLVRKVLEPDQYHIFEAQNGVEALNLYHEVHPDLVLLDGSMPVMDGFECCSHLRREAPIHTLPILIITGLEDDQSVNAAFDAGATDYIQKPINWLVLRRRVQLLLRMLELHSQLIVINSQLQVANQELKDIAYIDELTNLFNRRSLDTALAREWIHSLQSSSPLSLIMCDVDCFKQFNDTYGHPAGDRCLQQVGEVIRSSIRWPVDIGARYGGEEFTIVLTNTPLMNAVRVAERVRTEIFALNIPHQNTLVRDTAVVTLSLSVSSTQTSSYSSLEDFIQDADRKLYQAKAQGRNQVVFQT